MFRDSGYWRSLFFRSLVWSLGYIVQPNIDYSHSIEIEIDDWGTSDKGYLSFPTGVIWNRAKKPFAKG
jgi:hypothetical protein